VLTVNAVDGDARAFVEDVVARHLERFATIDELSCAGRSTPPDRHGQCRQTLSY